MRCVSIDYMPSKDVHVLILGTCEYVVLWHMLKATFQKWLNEKYWDGGDNPELAGWVQCTHKGP